jgi:ferrous iron transport protein B
LFIRKAGTNILAISIVLWWMMSYPKAPAPEITPEISANVAQQGISIEHWTQQRALEQSYAGRIGRTIEPAIAPLGFDWRIGVGIVSSFAAREVVVSALSVIYGVGAEASDGNSLLIGRLAAATHPDGTPVFGFATCASLLVFYVLAMQCLPTLAVTRREAGGLKWALFQLAYMSALAYFASLITYQSLRAMGYA